MDKKIGNSETEKEESTIDQPTTDLLPNNSSLVPREGMIGNREEPALCNGSSENCYLVTLLPIIPLTMEKEEIFNSGDRVKYIGEDAALFGILDGEILEVVEDCDEWVRVRTSNKKPISVPALDLEVIA